MCENTVLVSQKPDLDHITFHWNNMTAAEFEEQWKVKKMCKKADFIHMVQVGGAFSSSLIDLGHIHLVALHRN